MVCVGRPEQYHCPTPFGSGRARACGDSLIETPKRTEMENTLTLIAFLAFWWLLQAWLRPRLGVPT